MSCSRTTFILILALWLFSHELGAQWRGPQLTTLGPAEGLPSIVSKIVADSTGYLYIASNVGLYRYDGHQFTFYGHDPLDDHSIGQGEVLNLIVARDGLIWMALRFGGLNSFNPQTGKFKRYPLPALPFRSIPSANGLYEDPDGMLWVGATHFRLLAFDRQKEVYTTYSPDWINPQEDGGRLSVLSITPDPHHPDTLWLSVLDYETKETYLNSYGLVSFNKRTKAFQHTPFSINPRYTDSTGVMWGTTWGNYIIRFDPVSMKLDTFQHHYHYEGQSMNLISRDIIEYKNKLLVTSSLSVMDFDGQQFTPLIEQKLTTEIYSLFSDPDQNLWIGTNQGALVLNPNDQHIRFFSLSQFGVFNRLFPGRLACDERQDVMYLSHTQFPHPSGYYRIPLDQNSNEEARFFPTPFPVQGLAMDVHHQLWAVGGGAIYHLSPVKNEFIKSTMISSAEKQVPGIMTMRSNSTGWIGMISSREFLWFHTDSQKIKMVYLDSLPGSVFAKSFDNGFDGFTLNNNHFAYLYSNEVHQVNLETGQVKVLRYPREVNPQDQRIQFAGEDQNGYLWMSTFVHIGQYELQSDSMVLIASYGLRQGMISAGATELHIDPVGRVWAFTGSGLNAIDPSTHEIRFYGTKEGLPIPFLDPRQVISLSDNRVATVCHNGLIVYQAEDLWNSGATENEPVVIKQIRIDGREISSEIPVNLLQHISLNPGNKGFDIEFQALVYPTDDKMEYSYRINELQDEWISIGRNQLITLPSLLPGEYNFEIKAGKPLSQAPIKALHITVPTPLYQKAWFVLLCLCILIAGIYALIQRRIRRIRNQEAEQTERNKKIAELELTALRSQMNPHFMFNSLNSIKNYILHAEPKLAAEYLSNFAHLIRMILQNSREKSITLQEELDTLILYIELEQMRFDYKFSFHCEVDEHIQLDQIMIPPMLLQPFVENAIWHGLMHKKEEGHLMLRFAPVEKMIDCIIEDDGVGRVKAAEMKSLSANPYKSMGMGITRDRIEIMNSMDALGISVRVIDKTNGLDRSIGTQVTVRIPGPSTIHNE